MALDDFTRGELRRSALGYVQRKEAATDVPARIRELRANIVRIEGRDGRAVETREQNEYELDQLLKLATALDVPTEVEEEAGAEAGASAEAGAGAEEELPLEPTAPQ